MLVATSETQSEVWYVARDLPAVRKTTTRRPVQFERSVGVGNQRAIKRQSLGGGGRVGEIDEAVAGVSARKMSISNLVEEGLGLESRSTAGTQMLTRKTCRESS